MNITLKGAFTAATVGLSAISAAPALAQDAPTTETSQFSLQITQENSFEELLQGASDATQQAVDYNMWFIDQILRGVENFYVEDVTMPELQTLALAGVQELASTQGTYTMDQFVEAALDGVLNTLDPHSDYMTTEEFAASMERSNGTFVGVGVRIEMDDARGLLKVVEPIDGSPALDAGIISGDYITHIDGESMQGRTLDEYTEMLQGTVGTDVEVTVERPGEPDPITVTITRDHIQARSPIIYDMIGDVAYIRITQFNALTTEKLEEAVADLQQQATNGAISGYVLDLRYNPGGLLTQAIGVVDSFIDSGGIVATGDATGTNLRFVQATQGDIINGAPLTILVNGASASASEIVAGALQDNGRATIIGTQTFGKGSVQSVFALGAYFRGREDGMKVTTQLYYTPSGDTIQNHGVTPDIRTEFQGTVSDGRISVSEATLAGVIANPEAVTDMAETHSTCDASSIVPDTDTMDDRTVFLLQDGTEEPDYQLLCAIEYLQDSAQYTVIEPIETVPVQEIAPAP